MGARQLLQSFDAWRATGEPLVLATVYETAGSTYSKAGHRILLAANGDYRGLVSGGCLEGDLAERSRGVHRERPRRCCHLRLARCGGRAMGARRRLQRLAARVPAAAACGERVSAVCGNRRAPRRDATCRCRDGRRKRSSRCARGCDGGCARDRRAVFGVGAAGAAVLRAAGRDALRSASARLAMQNGCRILFAPLQPIPQLLVLGGGLDAIPLVSMAAELGWFVTVADHRPGYLARGGFERAERARARRAGAPRRGVSARTTSTRSSS